ncbi:RNA-binding protein Cip2 [Schizosaccharomyces japonicus yFS275]|uniref:RNA-binding protein Cip2 n=1 Tax=Schizosaccharomyces japonicus (strain yFS275 / FY16936) TaxID=402676 RepID=B6JVZ8_SCHJY|nr:RNA-binding protein Cip2 [Schizosaccharomyces japonicus yFS275]EEB05549.2 RNA-binding protein Cip2 [Schizosaccharomyces japonicus yFS275]
MAEGMSQRPLTPLSQAFLATNNLSPVTSPLPFHSDLPGLRKKRSNFFPKFDETNAVDDERKAAFPPSNNYGYFDSRFSAERAMFPSSAASTPGIGIGENFDMHSSKETMFDGANALPIALQQALDAGVAPSTKTSLASGRTRLQTAWQEHNKSSGLSLSFFSAKNAFSNLGPLTTSALPPSFMGSSLLESARGAQTPSALSSASVVKGSNGNNGLEGSVNGNRVSAAIEEQQEETIPTAIVIKNIPFSLKKEVLFKVFTALDIPRPYAFNYHFDNGVFRGLAFANFHTPEEARIVVQSLNGYEISGRRLRVEWKRQLPAAERERIERGKQEKRLSDERRKQMKTMFSVHSLGAGTDIDMNDSATLNLYSHMILFYHRTDSMNELVLGPNLSAEEVRVSKLLASRLGLNCTIRGEGVDEHKQVVVSFPSEPMSNSSVSSSSNNGSNNNNNAPNVSSPLVGGGTTNSLRNGSSSVNNVASFRRGAPSLQLSDNMKLLRGYADFKNAFSDVRSNPVTPLESPSFFSNLSFSSQNKNDPLLPL